MKSILAVIFVWALVFAAYLWARHRQATKHKVQGTPLRSWQTWKGGP